MIRRLGIRAALLMVVAMVAVAGSATAAHAASGGGCSSQYHATQACISYGSHQLRGDFYINNWSNGLQNGLAEVYLNVNGTNHYMGAVPVACLCGSKTFTYNVASGSSGYAWEQVDFYDANGYFKFSTFSPTQWWP